MQKLFKTIWQVSAKTWLYLFIVTSIICLFALRNNNQQMVKLRSTVYAADKNNGDVNTALNNLRRYVFSHMNTNLSSGGNGIKPPIQLKYTYQRLYEAQLNKIQVENQKIFDEAQGHCPANNVGYDPARLACIENYAVNHGAKGANISIPAGLYEFDFLSPTWSPDLAGFSLIASLVFLVLFLVKLTVQKYKK
jgi:hypothetical protein